MTPGSRGCTRAPRSWLPETIGCEQGVDEDDELSHDGGDGDLGWFSGGDEAPIFGLQVRVEPHRNQRGHVEGLAKSRVTSVDEGAACPASRLPGDGLKPRETGGLSGISTRSAKAVMAQTPGMLVGYRGGRSRRRR